MNTVLCVTDATIDSPAHVTIVYFIEEEQQLLFPYCSVNEQFINEANRLTPQVTAAYDIQLLSHCVIFQVHSRKRKQIRNTMLWRTEVPIKLNFLENSVDCLRLRNWKTSALS